MTCAQAGQEVCCCGSSNFQCHCSSLHTAPSAPCCPPFARTEHSSAHAALLLLVQQAHLSDGAHGSPQPQQPRMLCSSSQSNHSATTTAAAAAWSTSPSVTCWRLAAHAASACRPSSICQQPQTAGTTHTKVRSAQECLSDASAFLLLTRLHLPVMARRGGPITLAGHLQQRHTAVAHRPEPQAGTVWRQHAPRIQVRETSCPKPSAHSRWQWHPPPQSSHSLLLPETGMSPAPTRQSPTQGTPCRSTCSQAATASAGRGSS